jgi:Uncharacterized conserved protein
MKALLSIKPEFADKIFSGEKLFEFRKTGFRQAIQAIVVYATMPVGKIIGEFEVEAVLADEPKRLWEYTKEYAGIPYSSFEEYFSGRAVAYAIKVKRARRYAIACDPYVEWDNFFPPQSFRYLKPDTP